jgi:hypothetical protein
MPPRREFREEDQEPVVFGTVRKLDTSAAKQALSELARAARHLNLNTHRSKDANDQR